MNYKAYPKRKDTEQRMARKRDRQTVFVHNKKLAKARRKAARLARQAE